MNNESGELMESKDTIRYDTRCYFNVRSKADISQKKCHSQDNVFVLAIKPSPSPPQDPRLSEPSDFSSEHSDRFCIYQPTTSEDGQSVVFFYPREIITTFTRATLC